MKRIAASAEVLSERMVLVAEQQLEDSSDEALAAGSVPDSRPGTQ